MIQFFFEVLIGGLLSGVMYSLVALGFVLIYKASGVFNFAQGSLVFFAALTFVGLQEHGLSFGVALLATLGVMVVAGLAIERMVLRPLVNQPPISLFMATIGLSFFIEGLAQLMWGANVRGLDLGLQDEPIQLITDATGMNVSKFDLAAAGIAAVLVAGLALFFSRTRIGRALRAVADDHQAALAVGIPLQQIWAIVWAVAGFVALVTGMLWGSTPRGLELGTQDQPFEWLMNRFNIGVSQFDVFAAVVSGVLVVLLAIFFQRTRIGRALRAVADDHQAALSVGIPLQQIWAIVWGVAGFVALVAGMLWGARNGVSFSLTFVVLKALPVLILGGFESIPGAIVGGLIIGAAEKLCEVYLGPYVGGGIEGWVAYVIALLFLLVRPEGLFGEKHIDRV